MKALHHSFEAEERQIEARFSAWGSDITLALLRVFRRFGHFRPLLAHLQLANNCNLLEQQDILKKLLAQYGKEIFLEAINQGRHPASIAMEQELAAPDQAGDLPVPAQPQVEAPPQAEIPQAIPEAASAPEGERRRLPDRRRNNPGRRMEINLMFEGCRRQGSCRRKTIRRASDM